MNRARRYLELCQDEWTGRTHIDGSPCHAKPGNCPFEKRTEKGDLISGKENDILSYAKQIAEEVENGNAVHQRVPKAALQGLQAGTRVLAEASAVARRGETPCGEIGGGVGAGDRSAQEDRAATLKQESLLKDYAEHEGIWLDNADLELDRKYKSNATGSETIAYFDEPNGRTFKVMSDNFYSQPIHNLDRIALHNWIFPETAMKLLGIGTIGSDWFGRKFSFIVEQPLIQIKRGAKQSEVDAYMDSLGFIKKDDDLWLDKDESVRVSDLHNQNVVVSEKGNIYVIDADIRLNTPRLGFGGKYMYKSII